MSWTAAEARRGRASKVTRENIASECRKSEIYKMDVKKRKLDGQPYCTRDEERERERKKQAIWESMLREPCSYTTVDCDNKQQARAIGSVFSRLHRNRRSARLSRSSQPFIRPGQTVDNVQYYATNIPGTGTRQRQRRPSSRRSA